MANLVRMDRASYDASSFLDRRIQVPAGAEVYELPFQSLSSIFQNVAESRTRFLFHISHVGSTLISKLIGSNPNFLSLREPVLLRNLSEYKQTISEPESRIDRQTYLATLKTTLGLLARPLGEASEVVVKATSYANILASDILSLQPHSRAVGIYSQYENFAANILKGGAGWLDILQMSPVRMKRLHVMLGRQPWQLWRLRPGQVIAMSWLCEMLTLVSAASRHPGRFSWVEFDRFNEDPSAGIQDLCSALQLDWTSFDTGRMLDSGLLNVYGKSSDRVYGASDRKNDILENKARHSSSIDDGKKWLVRAIHDHSELTVVKELI